MARTVAEWIGKNDDSRPPNSVRLRVFDRYEGRCHISGRKIQAGEAWDLDHVIALVNWSGEGHGNRESNLAPALRDKHREKTKADVAEKAKVDRIKAKHLGLHKPKSRLTHPRLKRKMDGSVVER